MLSRQRNSRLTPRERYDDIVDALCAFHGEVRASRIFGMPCLKRNGKVVVGFWRDAMVFKLTDPAVHTRALMLSGAQLFDPSGRGEGFRQWVVVPATSEEEWEPLAAEALVQDHSIKP